MTTLEEIQQLIRQLTRFERERLAEWILNSADFGDQIAEAAAEYVRGAEGCFLTVEEYLRLEEQSPVRHEYVGGMMFAMSGVMLRHNVIIDGLTQTLNVHLHGGDCRAISSGVKVQLKVDRTEVIYYPDVTVVCGPQDMGSYFLSGPRLIVEILSPSTERLDLGEKALNYRQIASLEEYAVIAQRTPHVTVRRRSEGWAPVVTSAREAIVEFRSIGLSLPLQRIYEGTGL